MGYYLTLARNAPNAAGAAGIQVGLGAFVVMGCVRYLETDNELAARELLHAVHFASAGQEQVPSR